MTQRKILKVVALLLILVVAVTVPLVGCKKAEPPVDTDTGSGGSGTQGGDAGAGNEIGPWGSEWTSQWAAGQHYRYTINSVSGGTNTPGWYSLDFEDAGGGKLKVVYAGNIGIDFSGDFIADDSNNIDWSKGITDLLAGAMLLGLMVTPTLALGMGGEHGWDVGTSWSGGEGEGKYTFGITEKRSFAGITGAYGQWTAADGTGCVFCINPNVPLALYLKLITDDTNYMEYVLTECSGF